MEPLKPSKTKQALLGVRQDSNQRFGLDVLKMLELVKGRASTSDDHIKLFKSSINKNTKRFNNNWMNAGKLEISESNHV